MPIFKPSNCDCKLEVLWSSRTNECQWPECRSPLRLNLPFPESFRVVEYSVLAVLPDDQQDKQWWTTLLLGSSFKLMVSGRAYIDQMLQSFRRIKRIGCTGISFRDKLCADVFVDVDMPEEKAHEIIKEAAEKPHMFRTIYIPPTTEAIVTLEPPARQEKFFDNIAVSVTLYGEWSRPLS